MTTALPYPAPDFSLKDAEGTIHRLADWRGKWLVLYFYPKDDTPGCSIEACGMRDARDELTELGADVVAVSRDEADSHEKFKAKHNLNFTLLSDPDKQAIEAYGAWGKNRFGREGILRKTFIINHEGQVVKVYGRVIPLGHGEKIVADLKLLRSV
jgi:peroxiredoxin Q/BCP